MSNEMIERVARASFNCWRKRMTELGHHLDKSQTFEEMKSSEAEFALIHAKAIIEAMREPTDDMIQAGLNSTNTRLNIEGSAITVNLAKMKIRYQAMMQAALKE